jgi:thioredoxin-like negative regulator of GroEL
MIERLLLAAALSTAALLFAFLIRAVVQWRSDALAGSVVLPASTVDEPRLLVFSSRWCSDCATQRGVIDQFRERWSRPLQITFHDAATESDFAGQFGIVTVPALVVARPDGRVVGVRQGLVGEDRLRSLIEGAV